MSLCLITLRASYYRQAIYRKMAEALNCDFYSGNDLRTLNKIPLIDFSTFPTKHKTLTAFWFFKSRYYWQKGVLNLLGKYDISILTGDPFCVSTWFFSLFNKLFFRKKVVFWTHGWYGHETYIKKIIKKIFFSLSDRILVYGDRAKDLMIKEGINASKLYPVHNSLDYDTQNEIIKHMPSNNPIAEHFKNDYPTIFFSGRLTAPKKIDLLVKAVSQLKDEGVNINCVLMGNGSEKQKLESLVNELSLDDRFWFYGPCYDESTIGSMYWNAAICVSPGNVGLTAIHAMTYGCPVITHNNFAYQMPEFEVIVPGKTGDFYEYGNIPSMKEMVKKWICNSMQDKLLVRKECQDVIQQGWTPDYQLKIIKECCNF